MKRLVRAVLARNPQVELEGFDALTSRFVATWKFDSPAGYGCLHPTKLRSVSTVGKAFGGMLDGERSDATCRA